MFPSFLHFPIGLYSAALSLTFRGFSDMSRSRKRSSGPSRNTLRWRTWAEQRDSPPRWTRPSSCFKSFPKISGHSQLHNSNLRCYRRERTAGQVWSHPKGGGGRGRHSATAVETGGNRATVPFLLGSAGSRIWVSLSRSCGADLMTQVHTLRRRVTSPATLHKLLQGEISST